MAIRKRGKIKFTIGATMTSRTAGSWRFWGFASLVGLAMSVTVSRAESQPPRPASGQATSTAARSTRTIAAQAIPASVTIVALDPKGDTLAVGSGFVVRSDGVVVTNHHVLEGAVQARVVRANGEILNRVVVLDADSVADLAVLKVTALDLPVVQMHPTLPPVGDKVVVLGAPLGFAHSVSEGIISAIRVEGGQEQVQMTAPISAGSSGGPVLDTQGRVVGITRATVKEGQALNFAIPARYAMALLADALQRSPRAIAEVFAATVPVAADEAASRATVGRSSASASKSRLSIPSPSAPRRGALIGTFRTQTEVDIGGRSAPDAVTTGLLAMTSAGDGFWRPRFSDGFVMLTSQAVTTSTGRVGFRVGRIPLEGWVTTEGFYVAGADVEDGTTIKMIAEQVDLPLSEVSGVYDVSVRTTYVGSGGYRGEPTDWAGEAVVMATADSVWLDFTIENSHGGATGAFVRAKLTADQRFRWSDELKQVVGVVRNGRLEFDWVDKRRDAGTYSGRVTGTRR